MKNISKIKLNLLQEKLYVEGLCNELYTNIAFYGERDSDIKLMIESSSEEKGTNKILNDVVTDLKLAPKFIFTFGSGIGAFHGPVSRLLQGSGFSMTKEEVVLLIITAIAILLNEPDSKKLMDTVKEKGLLPALKGVKDLISSVQEIINNITRKVINTTYSLSDVLSFTFLLVPTMQTISKLINDYGITTGTISELVKGLLFATITYSVKGVLKKIGKRFND